MMNNMLPSISKDGILGKRPSEVIKDKPDGQPEKRKKINHASFQAFK
jgi:hypothetical protein